jgi:predicted enzyme related to lactoylglutathione lyase
MVKEMAFVAYSVRDVPKATAFYRDTIGLKPIDAGSSEGWVEFDVGNTTFGIGNGESLGIMPGSGFSAAFEIDDVTGERDRLKKLGIEVTDIMEAPKCLSCFVTDPEGNRFALHQRTA